MALHDWEYSLGDQVYMELSAECVELVLGFLSRSLFLPWRKKDITVAII